jgi:hypothetical protein
LKIISKRAKALKPKLQSPSAPYNAEVEHSLIITGAMSPSEIKAAEEAFKEIRRRLEDIGIILP